VSRCIYATFVKIKFWDLFNIYHFIWFLLDFIADKIKKSSLFYSFFHFNKLATIYLLLSNKIVT